MQRGPGQWELGWRFETWDALSGPNRFKPLLLSWAREFGSADEIWILEGALETLSAWHEFPHWRKALDVRRFCLPFAGYMLVDYERFTFEDAGWSPQCETWSSDQIDLQKRFKRTLRKYERRVRRLIERRGGRRARLRHSVKNLEWFAYYQLRGMSSVQIAAASDAPEGDASTVLKGIKTAAQLLSWTSLRSPEPSTRSRK